MSNKKFDIDDNDLKYLELLATQFPDIQSVSTEIINLQAILNLPKGTEFFLTDIHGEYEAFTHMLKSASGVIKHKINDIFASTLHKEDIDTLATLIYYPEEKLELIKKDIKNMDEWYRITLRRLVQICRVVSSKYTRSKIRKALADDFAYIFEELLHQDFHQDKEAYYEQIIKSIIEVDRADSFIVAISNLIQKLAVDRLHILGDIYDRGPGADIVMDSLMEYKSVDIQWGNHDIIWIGAAAGSEACMANVIRIALRYCNLDILKDAYGINLLPLATFAMEEYGDDPCTSFIPKDRPESDCNDNEFSLISKMHKAISIIQFKLEGVIIKRRFKEELDNRLLLDKINYDKGTIKIKNKEYQLNDSNFPIVDINDPYNLSSNELDLINKLRNSFLKSEKLQQHIQFLFAKGSMYKSYNSNLLFHGCIPLNKDGSFKKVKLKNEFLSGKEYIDELENIVINAYFNNDNLKEKDYNLDYIWYLWKGPNSPLFGKDKMTTFERYFIDDKSTHIENRVSPKPRTPIFQQP
ncbi:fructose-1,6-bisphosphatase [Halanaerobiaceae bacterium ANBcell28]